MRRAVLYSCFLCVIGVATSSFAAISIFNDYTDAQVYDGANTSDAPYFNTGGTVATATLPGYSSTTASSYATAGDAGNFSALFDHLRQGNYTSYAYSQIQVDFTMAVNSTYTATGSYANPPGHTALASYLYDGNVNAYVYNSFQESYGGPTAFSLGGSSGNVSNTFTGSLTGLLLAGHTYSWSAIAFTQAYPDPDSGAEAGGGVSLAITPVPEATSVMIWSLFVLTVGGACWWQKRISAA